MSELFENQSSVSCDRHTVCVYMGVKNCANLLAESLPRLLWADEIIVADASDDGAIRSLCEKQFPQVRYFHSTVDDGYQRAAAILPEVKSDFILGVDSDEFYTPELAQEILGALRKPCPHEGFILVSDSFDFGCYTGDGPPQLRLFRKGSHTLPMDGSIHEMPGVRGSVGRLKNHYEHRVNPKLGMNAVKEFRYEGLNAARLSENTLEKRNLHFHRGLKLDAQMVVWLLRLNWRFLRVYFQRRHLGFAGLCMAYGQVFYSIARHVCPTEEWRMRRGFVERGNRGYY